MTPLDLRRRTKIVCTLGPASANEAVLRRLIRAGMDVARLNFSHGSHEAHAKVLAMVRRLADEESRTVAVLQDLSGPKLRAFGLPPEGLLLESGGEIVFAASPEPGKKVGITLPSLAADVNPGERILLDDGMLELVVTATGDGEIRARVIHGGVLREGKGVNLPESRLSISCLTEKDRRDAVWGARNGVDFMALSFVRTAEDIRELRQLLQSEGVKIPIVAKIERPEPLRNLPAVLTEADAVMVARGDLGVEVPLHEVPMWQKKIIAESIRLDRPVITATQMLQSMVDAPRPTRAEATDVATAIFDGTDAVMLSAETASGNFPVESVEVMDRIAREAERYRKTSSWRPPPSELSPGDINADSVCSGAVDIAQKCQARLIVAFTAEGRTAKLLSRYFPSIPVIGVTFAPQTARRMALLNNVTPIVLDFAHGLDDLVVAAESKLLDLGWIRPKDRVVSVCSSRLGKDRKIDMVRVSQVM